MAASGRALRKTWQVTEKANPFMPKPGNKATQNRNLNDQVRKTAAAPSPSSAGIRKFLGRAWKAFTGEVPTEPFNWTVWEQNLRTNIGRHIREEEKRQTAFKEMMHRAF